jgi:thiamine-monophosphate kinase
MPRVFWSQVLTMAARSSSRKIPGELALIETIRKRAGAARSGSPALRVGIGDDCAVLRPNAGHEICVTTDFTLENTHFRRDWHPPESVGHRCLARGLSDLAAMGAEPLAVFLSLAIPRKMPGEWVDRFLDGFLALAKEQRVPLAGGDTAQSPAVGPSQGGLILADVVAVGQVRRGKALLRSGARPGDGIYVTGAVGGAAAELAARSKDPRKFRRRTQATAGHPHLYPEPRIAVGLRLRGLAHAAIDVSDGLSTDLNHLCEESGVAAVIDEAALPVHPLAAGCGEPMALVLGGGEDYELLFTAPRNIRVPRRLAGVPIHRIGMVKRLGRNTPRILLKTLDGRQIAIRPGGWEHFRN